MATCCSMLMNYGGQSVENGNEIELEELKDILEHDQEVYLEK